MSQVFKTSTYLIKETHSSNNYLNYYLVFYQLLHQFSLTLQLICTVFIKIQHCVPLNSKFHSKSIHSITA